MTGAPWYSAYIIGFLVASVLWMAWAWWLLDQRAAARRDRDDMLSTLRTLRARHHRAQLARDAKCACRRTGTGGCDAA